MPSAQVAELFRRRASSAPARHTGLGMAIVDALVAEMNGTVELASTLGVGTTIRIVLPIRNVTR
jgi:signal transduction histidine kinase